LAAHTWRALSCVGSDLLYTRHAHFAYLPSPHGLCSGSHARGSGVACAARARRLAAQALLLICWPGRLPVTVDSQKPHRSFAASHPLPNLVIPLLPWQLISLSPSLSLLQISLTLSLKLSLSLISLSISYFSLLPSFPPPTFHLSVQIPSSCKT